MQSHTKGSKQRDLAEKPLSQKKFAELMRKMESGEFDISKCVVPPPPAGRVRMILKEGPK